MSRMKCLVIHCTATPEGHEVTAADTKAWHTNPTGKSGRGWKQVGYTDLFKLDGTVERSVQNNEDANVDPWEVTNGDAGYNGVSRHIVYAGGVFRDGKTLKDTRTVTRLKAMERYVKDFHRRFPGVKIIGHNRLAAKACPSFDVKEWLQSIGIRNWMNTLDILRFTVEIILGIVAAGGLKNWTDTKKYRQEVEKLRAKVAGTQTKTRSDELENVKTAMDVLMEQMVEPLKTEINTIRREMVRLRKAVGRANDCPFPINRPVRGELQEPECVEHNPLSRQPGKHKKARENPGTRPAKCGEAEDTFD